MDTKVMYKAKLGHVHLKVRDLERAITFYTAIFNLKLVERVGDEYAFLTGSKFHHEISLKSVGPDALPSDPNGVGLFHLAFEVPDARSLAQVYKKLTSMNVAVGTVDHQISWALYFDDPDGNGLEVYWDTRKKTGVKLWQGKNLPLPSKKILSNYP